MGTAALVFILLVMGWFVLLVIRRRGRGIVAQRGVGVGADLGTLADKPRVRVRQVTRAGPDRVRLVLAAEPGAGGPGHDPSDLDLVVLLREDEFGSELLEEWERSGRVLALVMPPGSRIVRLRSIDDLQPLTLRRVDEG
ncbi:MAG: hypothetical protein ACHQNA_01995 [Acidimicrobiales bacterium]